MQPNSLTQGSVAKTLFRFACPFLVANVLQSLYGAADLFVVGAFCGAQSVAAVSTGTQVTQIVTSLVTGLTLGSTVIIGQYTGQGEYGKVKRAIGTTLTVFACVALALTAGSTALCLRTGSAPFLMIGALGTLFAALGGKKGLSNLRKACKI